MFNYKIIFFVIIKKKYFKYIIYSNFIMTYWILLIWLLYIKYIYNLFINYKDDEVFIIIIKWWKEFKNSP